LFRTPLYIPVLAQKALVHLYSSKANGEGICSESHSFDTVSRQYLYTTEFE
jgi:hypothetical protein